MGSAALGVGPRSAVNAAPAATGTQNTARLKAAAREFESVLVGQWLQNAESSFGSVPGGDEDADTGGDQMQSFGIQQLAGQLTASGGIGIARMVEQALTKAAGQQRAGAEGPEATAASAENAARGQRAASSAFTYSGETNP